MPPVVIPSCRLRLFPNQALSANTPSGGVPFHPKGVVPLLLQDPVLHLPAISKPMCSPMATAIVAGGYRSSPEHPNWDRVCPRIKSIVREFTMRSLRSSKTSNERPIEPGTESCYLRRREQEASSPPAHLSLSSFGKPVFGSARRNTQSLLVL